MKKRSSFVKTALGFEEAGIFGDIEDICPTNKIGSHLGSSRVDFRRIVRTSGQLTKKDVPILKAQ